jgi:3D (Asp-Asp-Asp) domain-containing protein
MRRILACLATLSIGAAAASGVHAQGYDPIGDIIAGANESAIENANDWTLKATLYHGGGGMSSRDSMGCRVSPMRTVAIDRALITRGAILFIKETVGMLLPGGGKHDGYWYASDTGGAIKGARIDLFTGPGAGSMRAAEPLNLKTLTVTKVGEFKGCPPIDGGAAATTIAAATTPQPPASQPSGPQQPSGLDEGALEHKIAGVGDGALVEAAIDQQSLEVGEDGGSPAKHQPVAIRVEFRQSDIGE